jgi:hypothetical protein
VNKVATKIDLRVELAAIEAKRGPGPPPVSWRIALTPTPRLG